MKFYDCLLVCYMKMRLSSFFILFILLGQEIHAQKAVKGYYVGLNNDSIPAIFRIPKRTANFLNVQSGNSIDFSDLKDEVVIIDGCDEVQRLMPTEIKGFVFNYGSAQYKLFSKPATEYRRNFLQPQIIGRKVNLFHYSIGHPGHPAGFGHKTSSNGWKDYYWTFEKHDRTYLFVNSRMRKKEIVRLLKKYFSDDTQMQELIDQKFRRFIVDTPKAVQSIVESYNSSE